MNISDIVKAEMQRQKVSVTALSQKTGYSPYYIYALLQRKKRWNEDTLGKICNALNLKILIQPTGTNGK